MKEQAIALIILIAFICGCANNPGAEEPTQMQLYSQPKTIQFNYTVDGEGGELQFTAYKGLSDYLKELPRTVICAPICHTNTSKQLMFLNEKKQQPELERFAEAIDNITPSADKRRIIAISIIQNIPYDENQFQTLNASINRYPYQVLYDAKGICEEKTRLLAYILGRQGLETAALNYHEEKHVALGVKCPREYSTQKTGYCFIETTSPAIPTFDQGIYPGFGKIKSAPEILVLSNGTEYHPLQEYLDAQEWTRIQAEIIKSGGTLSEKDYDKRIILQDKYGIQIE
jgi:hypothetical protein